MSLAKDMFPTIAIHALDAICGTLDRAEEADTLDHAKEILQEMRLQVRSLIASAGEAATAGQNTADRW